MNSYAAWFDPATEISLSAVFVLVAVFLQILIEIAKHSHCRRSFWSLCFDIRFISGR